jgi:hypothetical protein
MRESTWRVVGAWVEIVLAFISLKYSVKLIELAVGGNFPPAVDVAYGTVVSLVALGLFVTVASMAFDDLTLWRDGKLVVRRT